MLFLEYTHHVHRLIHEFGAKNKFRHLEFFELLKDHVVGHVVKQAVARRQDDVTKLHVKRGAVGCFRAEVCKGDKQTRTHTHSQTDRSLEKQELASSEIFPDWN